MQGLYQIWKPMRWWMLLAVLGVALAAWQGVAVAAPPAQAAGTITVTTASTAGVGFTYPGFSHQITIVDADLDITGGVDQASVEITNVTSTMTTTIMINETGPATGTFVGTFVNTTAPISLTTAQQLRFRYNDANPATMVDVVFTAISTDGVVSVPANVSLMGSMTIQVNDVDQNLTDGPSNDTVNVTIQNLNNANMVNLVLNETTAAGQFSAAFAGIDDAPAAGLGSAIADVLQITYVDALDSAGTTNVNRVAVTTVSGATNATLTVTPAIVGPGEVFTVSINDPDANAAAGGSNDTVPFEVQNVSIGSVTANINAPETTTPGLFFFNVPSGDYGLNAANGHNIRISYTDNTPAGGGAPLVITVFIQAVTPTASGTNSSLVVTDTIPGRSINVTLNAPALGTTATATISVHNVTTNGTVETLVIANTGTSGQFAGSISTAFGTTSDGLVDGIIAVKGGDVVRFTFAASGNAGSTFADSDVRSRRSTALFCNAGTSTSNPAWFAEYFPNKDLSGSPAVVAEEFNLSVNWEETAPFRELPADGWSGRWTTQLVTQEAKYRFRIGADDGVRFFVDDQLFLDNFTPSPFATATVDIALPAGNHTFRVEYFEDTGSAGLLVDCIFLENPVAAIDPSSQDARGGFDITNIFLSDYDLSQARAHVATGNLYVRANPHITAARIDTIHLYASYRILGVTEDNGWYLIDLRDGRTGWVATQFIYRAESTPVQIYPNFVGSEAPLPNIEVAGFATQEIKIRTQPRGDEIGRLPADVQVRIFARSGSGAWYRIEFDGIPGWVYAPYMELVNGTVQDLPSE